MSLLELSIQSFIHFPDNTGALGIAEIGSVCQPKSMNKDHEKHSLSVWDKEITYAAQTVGHEVGHNLGMWHDFNER